MTTSQQLQDDSFAPYGYDEHMSPAHGIRSEEFWRSELNPNQWEAVRNIDDPLLVIAGAGSGKTRVLTYKIAYLLEHGYEPWQVLALTFTNKAAREMNERIGRIAGQNRTTGLWSGTFHSIFARILRMECSSIGLPHDFTIYDTPDQRSLLKSIVKEMALDEKVYKPALVSARISNAKNRLILPEAYAADERLLAHDKADNLGEIHRIYSIYWQRCRTAGAVDFDDLLLYTYLLFSRDETAREKYANRFRYILVDEYQDTNYAQHQIVALLTRDNHHICVVGDDAQSIYSFRGANIDNILNFTRQHPNAQVVKLERNYRSTQCIVGAANSIIAHNRGQIAKRVYSENAKGDPLTILAAASDKEEAVKVCATIQRLVRREGAEYDAMAILYRTNAQSRSFEDALRQRNIPYRIYGGLSFYQRKEIKDILAYCRLVTNLDDEEAFKRIVNYPTRGIGATTLQKIIAASHEHKASLWAVVEHPDHYGVTLGRAAVNRLEIFCSLILSFREAGKFVSVYDLVHDLITQSGIKADLAHEDGPEGDSKRENVEELLSSIKSYEDDYLRETGNQQATLAGYLGQISLMTDADQKDDGLPKVTLMTAHAAKGLEFDNIFVTGLEQELFPAGSAMMFPREMEEERRLFYVAVTRAKTRCYLTYARSRFRYGNMEFAEPSQFISEIDSRYRRDESSNIFDQRAEGITPSQRARLFDDSVLRPYECKTQPKLSDRGYSSPVNTQPRPTGKVHPSPVCSQSPAQTYSDSVRGRTLRRAASLPSSPSSRAATDAKASQLSVGTIIEHERFGRGCVVALEGSGDGCKARVDFGEAGIKNLLLKFARYTVIS